MNRTETRYMILLGQMRVQSERFLPLTMFFGNCLCLTVVGLLSAGVLSTLACFLPVTWNHLQMLQCTAADLQAC